MKDIVGDLGIDMDKKQLADLLNEAKKEDKDKEKDKKDDDKKWLRKKFRSLFTC